MPDLRERAKAKVAEVEARIAGLTTIRAALSQVVNAGCGSLAHCTCPDCPLPSADLADGGRARNIFENANHRERSP
uniref:hypothetical protein n=1 Tax=Nonomuraea bangladeshensis TaxID=404385 RepID=UPI003F498C75